MNLSAEESENIRKYFLDYLGREKVMELHQPKLWLDWLALLTILSLFFFLIILLATISLSFIWIACLFAQGFTIQLLALFAHDACTHRKFAGRATYWIDLVCCLPGLRLPSAYFDFHMKHHRFLNTNADPEVQVIYSLGKDSRVKRLLLCTFIGALLINYGSKRKEHYQSTRNSNLKNKIRKDYIALLFFIFIICLLLFIFPNYLFYGYILPLLITLPIASMSRIVIEHSDVDIKNPFQIATFYKTTYLTKLIYFFDSGDCHLVHHIFSGIPFYNINKAVKLMRPILLNNGVREHRSLLGIYYGFFIQQKPFRGPWIR